MPRGNHQQIPVVDIQCWTACLERDAAQMHQVNPENTRRPLFNVTVESVPPVVVGTAYNFKNLRDEFVCTVGIDQTLWRKCMPAFQEGVAVYAGPFKIIGGLA